MALRRSIRHSHIVALATVKWRIFILLLCTFSALASSNAQSVTPSDGQPIPWTQTADSSRVFRPVLSAALRPLSIQLNLPSGVVNRPYSGQISLSGGVPPYSFILTSGSLPRGLILSRSLGSITGTPTLAATNDFKLTVVDASGASLRTHGQIVISNLTTAVPATVAVNPTGATIASGARQQFSVIASSNARSVSPSDSQRIRWIQTAGSPRVFRRVSSVALRPLSIQLNLPSGVVNTPYSGQISASGGVLPYSFILTSGSLPRGLILSPSLGSVTGTPIQAATSNFKLTVVDASGASVRTHGQIVISNLTTAIPVTIAVNPTSATIASGATQQFGATIQGTSNTAVSWSASAGTISSTGLFAAPVVTSNTSVAVTATSAGNPGAQSSVMVTVTAPTPISVAISPATASLPSGGTQLFTASVSGTTTGVAWTATSGTISSDGHYTAPVISSNTTAAVTATSLADPSKSASVSISIAAPSPSPATSSGSCPPPTYCADTGTEVKNYPVAAVPAPPGLNMSYTDPVFNRKIWRWTDGSASPINNGSSMGLVWHAGDFAGGWNQLSNALITSNDHNFATILKIDTSNPSAPVASTWPCTDTTTGLCSGGKIAIPYSPIFANTSDYLVYYMSADGKLSKADFTATYTNPATAPAVTSPWYDPYASGNCASALTRPNGSINPIVTSDDQYFTGFGPDGTHVIVWHAGDANCTLITMSGNGGAWLVSGVGQQGGGTGTVVWTDESGNAASTPGLPCSLHGAWYDQLANTVVFSIASSSSNCPNMSGYMGIHLNLSTLHAYVCKQYGCGGGHGLGETMHAAGLSYDCNGAVVSAQTNKEYCSPLLLPDSAEIWAALPAFANSIYPDVHHGTVWTDLFPLYSAAYMIDTQESASAPANTLATLTVPFADEIDVWTTLDSSGSTNVYRYVHTYEADANYNSGGAYASAVGPALSPNKCWVAFPSNWYGHLGTSGNRTAACTTSGSCAYDVFAVYLCGGPGS